MGDPEKEPKHDPTMFRVHASGAYGKGWQWRMALARGLNLRTVANWAAGKSLPPPDLVSHLKHVYAVVSETGAEDRIARFAGELIAEGVDRHALAALLEAHAEKLSPRGTPAGVGKKQAPT